MKSAKQPCGCVVTTDNRDRQTIVLCAKHEAEYQVRHEAARVSGSGAWAQEKTNATS